MSGSPTVHFTVSLQPYRSLSPEGFTWLIRGAIAANLLIGIPMLILGAWPVFGFMGLDVWLLWWFVKRSYFDARRGETLTLTDSELIVERWSSSGDREHFRLEAYWLRIESDEERLVLVSRGIRLTVGRFLSPVEREALADRLKAALAGLRSPR